MTAVVNNLYDIFRENSYLAAAIDIEGATLKAMLVTNTEVPDQNLDEFINAADANEVTGTGYTAGGNACANPTVSLDGSGNITVDCDDPASYAQNGAGFSNARRTIIYDDTGTPSTSPVISFSAAYASDQGNVAGAFASTINASGLITEAR